MQRRRIDHTRDNDNNNSQQNSGNSRAFNMVRERALYNEFAQPFKEQILQQHNRETNDEESLKILQAYQAYRAQAQAEYLKENPRLPAGETEIVDARPNRSAFSHSGLNRYIAFLRNLQVEEEQISNTLAKISPGLLVSTVSEINLMFKKRMIDTSQESCDTLKLTRSNIKKIIDYKQGRGVTLQEVIKPFKEIQYIIETFAQSLSQTNLTKDGAYLSRMNQLIEIWKKEQILQ